MKSVHVSGALLSCAWSLLLAVAALGIGCDRRARDEQNVVPVDAPVTGAPAMEGCGDGEGAPPDLRCTGLYEDWATKRVAVRARSYAPAVAFWSDGAEKQRYLELPDGATIDAADPDEWRFPVGTKVWKEFRAKGRLLETRFFWKTRDDRWVRASYLWSEDGTRAPRSDGASINLGETRYVIPTPTECDQCHKGRKDRLLGVDAVALGLPGAQGLTLAALAGEGRLAPAPATTSLAFAPDGADGGAAGAGDVTARALSWLHVNCGTSCHNGNATATAYPTGLRLRLRVAELDGAPHAWDALTTALDVGARTPKWSDATRIVPGDPDASLLVSLIAQRGQEQMPPLGSNVVDDDGVARVKAWIAALPRADDGVGGGIVPTDPGKLPF